MSILPEELINKILIYREQHPIAKMLDTYCKRYQWPFIDFMEWKHIIYPRNFRDIKAGIYTPHSSEVSFFQYLTWKNISKQGCSDCHKLSKMVLGGRKKVWILHQPHFKKNCKNKNINRGNRIELKI